MSTLWGADRSRTAWWALAAVLAAAVGFVVYSFIGTFVFGVFLYYATRPVYARLKRRVRPPSLAAALALLTLALPALLLLAYSLAIGLQEINRFAERYEVGSVETYIGPYLNVTAVPLSPEEFVTGNGLSAVGDVVVSATRYVGFLGIAALHLFVMIAIAFYLLRDGHKLSRWVHRRFGDAGGVLESYFGAIHHSYHQIFFGNIVNAALTGIIGAIAYNTIDLFAPPGLALPYPTLIGLLAGVASLIPIVGMKLVYFPATAYLAGMVLVTGEPRLLWFPVAFATVSFVIVDVIPDLVLRPYVSGGGFEFSGRLSQRLHLDAIFRSGGQSPTPGMHVGAVMLAYVFGPLLFGWYGIFLGPMLLVLVVHFARIVLPELVVGQPIQPYAVDPTHLTEPADPEVETPSTGPDDAVGGE